ncbi:hypothetical protein [Arthrobacter sp. VKM Ac-2550]|uniref:hypothetical protein n=1 Tax=Crystallibacter permensis TaxID=1938888 RepID=UPI002226B09D|nr:hypothetical protein [Arthrobacter sp. VKM Ac-2550]MCW2132102.1 hypothetical protein [Arthrobacter sp. VKM Ac-2550]
MELFAVILLAGVAFIAGWFISLRRAGTNEVQGTWAAKLPPPAQIYEEGYRQGYLDAQAAMVPAGGVQTGSAGQAPEPQVATQLEPAPQTTTAQPTPAFGPPSQDLPQGPLAGHQPGLHQEQPLPGYHPVPGQHPVPNVSEQAPVLDPAVAARHREEEERKRVRAKQRRDLRNINITLYSASLLLVAAAALFIGSALPASARAVTIFAVTLLFYTAGLAVYTRAPRLRPAGIAFTGTGLALLPVAGLALYNFVLADAAGSWLLTALVGTAAYAYAAVRMQSQVVAYLSLPFFISIAWSAVAVLGGALAWYFTFSIALAATFSLVSYFRPRWVPGVYGAALVAVHRYLTPLAVLAAFFVGDQLQAGDNALLLAMAAGYYGAMLFTGGAQDKLANTYGLRITVTLAAMYLVVAAGGSWPWALFTMAAVLAIQAAALAVFAPVWLRFLKERPWVRRRTADGAGPAASIFRIDLGTVFVLQALLTLLQVLDGIGATGRPGPEPVLMLLLLAASAFTIAWKFGGWAESLIVLPALSAAVLLEWNNPWRQELLLGLALVYLLARIRASAGRERLWAVSSARGAATLLLPITALTHLPQLGMEQDLAGRTALLVLALGFVVNQIASTVLLERMVGSAAPRLTVLVSAALGFGTTCGLIAAELPAAPGVQDGSVHLGYPAFWAWTAAGVASSFVLAPRSRHQPANPGKRAETTLDAPAGLMEPLAPVILAAGALLGTSFLGVRGYEILVGVVLVYAAAMAAVLRKRGRKGVYLLAAQLSLTGLVALIGQDLDASIHVLFVLVACTTALQEAARLLIRRRLGEYGLQRVSAWLGLVLLAVLPWVYGVAVAAPQRGVVVLQLLLLIAVAAARFRQQQGAGPSGYVSVYGVASLTAAVTDAAPLAETGWLPALLSADGGALAALLFGAVAAVLRVLRPGERLRYLLLAATAVFMLEALALSLVEDAWMTPVALFGAAVLFFVLSHREQLPWLYAGGAVSVLAAALTLMQRLQETALLDFASGPAQWLAAAWLTAVLLYGFRLTLRERENADPVRAVILTGVALGVLGLVSMLAIFPGPTAIAASLSIIVAAALAVIETPERAREAAAEGAFFVFVLAVQRLYAVAAGWIDPFWALQWWVVAGALVAAYEYVRGRDQRGTIVLAVAAGGLSLSGFGTIILNDAGKQIWALLGHGGLLVAGVVLSRRLFTVWGAVGIALALLWFMRGFTFVLLAFAALALLAFAVRKLMRHGKQDAERQ